MALQTRRLLPSVGSQVSCHDEANHFLYLLLMCIRCMSLVSPYSCMHWFCVHVREATQSECLQQQARAELCQAKDKLRLAKPSLRGKKLSSSCSLQKWMSSYINQNIEGVFRFPKYWDGPQFFKSLCNLQFGKNSEVAFHFSTCWVHLPLAKILRSSSIFQNTDFDFKMP